MDILEFSKWFFNRSRSYLFLVNNYYDKHMRGIIDNQIKEDFDFLKRYFSNPVRDLNIDPLEEEFFEPANTNSLSNDLTDLLTCLDERDLHIIKEIYLPKNYSYFPIYHSCSWKLNREFRVLHDRISDFLHVQ